MPEQNIQFMGYYTMVDYHHITGTGMGKIIPWIYLSCLWTVIFSKMISGHFLQCPRNCTCQLTMEQSEYLVDCSNRGLIEMPSNVPFYTTNLDISGNKLTQFTDSTFDNLTNIKVLDASQNILQHIEILTFNRTKKLERLNLAGNKLRAASFLRGLFKPLAKSLKQLDISRNLENRGNETYPDESLQDLTGLRILKMDCLNGK